MFKKIAFYLSILVFLTACVEVTSYKDPNEILNNNAHYFLVVSDNDEKLIYKTIENKMLARGLSVEYGSRDQISENTKYLVEYGAQWEWDVTWFLYDFNVRIYDLKSGILIASANSNRSSFGRKSKDLIVTETLNQLFK